MTAAGQKCRGRLFKDDPSAAKLRLLQFASFSDDAWCRAWACELVRAKIQSQIKAARHYQKHGASAAGPVLAQLQNNLAQCEPALDLDQIRGLEGASTAAWFSLFGKLLKEPWIFTHRNRRPPRDPVNVLLSLGYTWLINRITARCSAFGLEIYLGALHRYRAGRPSLGCDLIEPMRIPAVDRWVLKICNEGHFSLSDFVQQNENVSLQPDAFGRMLLSWEEFWFDCGHEQMLHQWIDTLVRQLRRRTTLLSGLIDGEDQPDL